MRLKIQIFILLVIFGFIIVPLNAYFATNTTSQTPSKGSEDWIILLHQAVDNEDTTFFYRELNKTDRQKIRQAMDHAIDRQSHINSIDNGFGTLLATNIFPQNGVYFNKSIQVREFNLTKSLDLLEEVFGYRYEYDDNPDTYFDERHPYFTVTAIVPDNNLARLQWATLISSVWNDIGIDMKLKIFSWTAFNNRMWVPPWNLDIMGFDFKHGRFDIIFLGYQAFPDPILLYHSSDRQNILALNDSIFDDIINRGKSDPNEATRIAAVHEYQQWIYDWVPSSILRQDLEVWGLDPDLTGFNPFDIFNYANYSHPTQTSLVLSFPANFISANPIFQWYYYDSYLIQGVQPYGLIGQFLKDGDPTYTDWEWRPYLANWYNRSEDGLTWFFNLHEGLKWHDNETLDADDVLFTFKAVLNESTGTDLYWYIGEFLAPENIIKHNNTLVEFKLNKYSSFAKNDVFYLPLMPEHILNTTNDFYGHWTNLPNSTHGPIGYGPYKFTSKNSTTNDVILSKWDYYNGSLVGTAEPSIDEIRLTVIKDPFDAFTALENGQVDLIDPQSGLSKLYQSLANSPNTKPLVYSSMAYQDLGYNHYSPIFGHNPENPCIMYPNDSDLDCPSLTTTTPTLTTTSASTSTSIGSTSATTSSSTTTAASFDLLTIIVSLLVTIPVIYRKRKKS
ncbi:MAG: ABC transporter substrate-binding protein [Candidatus Hodarchaeales archaeon]|jgi:ABC-type transport system substrate-binding protein